MKKTQVALAALALVASTAAMADVKVYGNVDAGIISTNSTTAFFGGGNNATTLMGFRGSEDLGNGLKAGFNLETGLDIATGSYTGNPSGGNTGLFNRAANVSLSNENVGITLGNHISIAVLDALVNGATGVGGDFANVPGVKRVMGGYPGVVTQDAGTAAAGVLGSNPLTGFFIPQSVIVSASGAGITVKGQYRVIDKSDTNSAYQAVTASTSLAGVNVAVGYQSAGFTTSSFNYTTTFVAANTNFGDVRVNAMFGSNTGVAKSTGYLVGASMPIAGALSGGLTYADGGASGLGTQATVSLNYALSKSTSAYVSLSQLSVTGLATSGVANDYTGGSAGKSVSAIGLTHSF